MINIMICFALKIAKVIVFYDVFYIQKGATCWFDLDLFG